MRKSLLALVFASIVLLAGTALADPITITGTYGGNPYSATITVTSTTATLDLTGLGTTNAVAIHVVDGNHQHPVTVSLTSFTGTGFTGGAGNPGNQGANCDGSGAWFCASNGTSTIEGAHFVWTYSGGTGTITPYSAWFTIFNPNFVSNFSCAAGENSTDSNGNTCGGTSTPEPASLAFLSVGLIGLGGLFKRRK